MFETILLERAESLLALCRSKDVKLVTAESCTGGLIAALLTEIAGSSDVFERGFVTYSNAAKTDCLGVDAALISRLGAVSAEVAASMAEGALARSRADVAVSVTGIAGPGGGSAQKPVGLVYFGCLRRGREMAACERIFAGMDRAGVRKASVETALGLIESAVS
ncbi:CinA family protein [Methylocella sp.]|uniref:CinA family protein n=1 Tax=Methylocella sp. TaxID=1978226 RepID=UPI003782E4BC